MPLIWYANFEKVYIEVDVDLLSKVTKTYIREISKMATEPILQYYDYY